MFGNVVKPKITFFRRKDPTPIAEESGTSKELSENKLQSVPEALLLNADRASQFHMNCFGIAVSWPGNASPRSHVAFSEERSALTERLDCPEDVCRQRLDTPILQLVP